LIEAEKANFSVARMCFWAGVSVSGFYAWRRSGVSATAQVRVELAVGVRRVFDASNGTYGYRRVHAQLVREGHVCCDKLVAQIMAEEGLVSCHPAPWRYRTEQGDGPGPVDLIRRDFTARRPGVRFVGDITQIDTWEGPAYLSTMIDLFNREIAGWSMADNYRADLVCDTVAMARRNGRVRRRAIFHSDRGSQYTSKQFVTCLRSNRMRGSMGRVGTCYDNAVAESFFASLKKELVDRTVFPTREHARKAIANYIEIWYNRMRLHSGLDYQTPNEARERFSKSTAA
jgi:putative transposase